MRRTRKRKVKRRRRDRHFTPDEQSFFAAGERLAEETTAPDSFDDLDDAREPASFWARVARRPTTS